MQPASGGAESLQQLWVALLAARRNDLGMFRVRLYGFRAQRLSVQGFGSFLQGSVGEEVFGFRVWCFRV